MKAEARARERCLHQRTILERGSCLSHTVMVPGKNRSRTRASLNVSFRSARVMLSWRSASASGPEVAVAGNDDYLRAFHAIKKSSMVVHITSKIANLTFLSPMMCVYETLRSLVRLTPSYVHGTDARSTR
jgi:hypothetical protein